MLTLTDIQYIVQAQLVLKKAYQLQRWISAIGKDGLH